MLWSTFHLVRPAVRQEGPLLLLLPRLVMQLRRMLWLLLMGRRGQLLRRDIARGSGYRRRCEPARRTAELDAHFLGERGREPAANEAWPGGRDLIWPQRRLGKENVRLRRPAWVAKEKRA